VWGDAIDMTDGESSSGVADAPAQRRLLDLCSSGPAQIGRLYFLAEPSLWDERSLRVFLRAAAARGIEVYAMPRGGIQNQWMEPFPRRGRCRNGVVLRWLSQILAFNKRSPEAVFKGIQLDIEPHEARSGSAGSPDGIVWRRAGDACLDKNGTNGRIAVEYLRLLDDLRSRLRSQAPGMKLAATIPTWFDGDPHAACFRLEYAGKQQSLAYHVMDRVDFVTLMNYVDGTTWDSRERAWKNLANEVVYGPVEAIFETAAAYTSGEHPSPEETRAAGGEARYILLRQRLGERFAGDPNFLGCALHHYRNSYGSGSPGWPLHPPREIARR